MGPEAGAAKPQREGSVGRARLRWAFDRGRRIGSDTPQARTDEALQRYVDLAHRMGIPADRRSALGTDAVETAEQLCLAVAKEFPKSASFAGQVIFQREWWYDRWRHNQTAFAIQKRLQWAGMTTVILPVRVR